MSQPGIRHDLPSGTVTLLFTDIEGSTRLLRRLGSAYADVQGRHRRLLREAFARFGGSEVDTQGDAFMVAFRSAADAVAAAVEAQRALAAERWPGGDPVSVRMGIHTGEPERSAEGYVGLDVVRAARICAVAHGGQILLSEVTRELLADAGCRTRDLGRHRLKDIPELERLFQVQADGLPDAFPPPRTLTGSTLPALHHRLVGRAGDLAAVRDLLAQPLARLVTITGPGGAGKSRLALEAAAALARERPVQLVGLAPLADPALVLPEIGRAVGVRETGPRPLLDALADTLRGTRTLLFLDNLEHLAAAAPDLAALLDRVGDLEILCTSRTPLRLSGERVLPLAPLATEDAATLFVELAAARGVVLQEDALPSVHEICRRLDGLPLAIELVAARLVALPPARVLRALDEGLALDLEGPVDLPERQRTLRAAIEWSYRLLTDGQRRLHDALGVFAGSATLEDAQAVAGAGPEFYRDLEALVAWSLVRSDVADGDVRLSMLETVRTDAVARLEERGTLAELRLRHAERFRELAERAEDELVGPRQAEWLERLDLELDNLRAALAFAFASGRRELGLRLAAALSRFWRAHGHVTEARRWLGQGLAQADGVPRDVRAKALWAAARQAMAQSATSDAEALVEEALPLFEELGQEREVVFALSELAWIALDRDPARAEALSEQAVARARGLGDSRAVSGALNVLSSVVDAGGDHTRALALNAEALALRRALGDLLLVADSAYNLGQSAFLADDLRRAREAFEESLATAQELGDTLHVAASTCMLGELSLLEGDPGRARALLAESLDIYAAVADTRTCAECLLALALAAADSNQPDEAARLWGAAEALRADDALKPTERVLEARLEASLRPALGGELLATLRDEGQRNGRTLPLRHEAVSTAARPI
ncbi:MAG TPA: adenylate/guanylate cyclase domain-containing protein [Gaiellaceae bacterium]|nr:adenylate/guanylate cyclase domain-containing protein [Gaiellaceae bacterium]